MREQKVNQAVLLNSTLPTHIQLYLPSHSAKTHHSPGRKLSAQASQSILSFLPPLAGQVMASGWDGLAAMPPQKPPGSRVSVSASPLPPARGHSR